MKEDNNELVEDRVNRLLHLAKSKNDIENILRIVNEIPRYSIIPKETVLKYLNDIASNSYFSDGEIDYSTYESMVSIAQADLDEIVKSDENLLNSLLHVAYDKKNHAEILKKIKQIPKYANLGDDVIVKYLNDIASNSYFSDGEMDYSTYESMVSIAQAELDGILPTNEEIPKSL